MNNEVRILKNRLKRTQPPTTTVELLLQIETKQIEVSKAKIKLLERYLRGEEI